MVNPHLKILFLTHESAAAIGAVDKPLGRELRRLAGEFSGVQTMEQLDAPLITLKGYLKDIQ
ncbi:hypothetical protein [Pseudomonas fluorescens]|uniref:hypothetical protein n=1 Tax=Pseudomonas fluorescens TaxID=294 RepID=UPI0012405D53|nr:hypothetical protein [Pseudomonas fluorescens]